MQDSDKRFDANTTIWDFESALKRMSGKQERLRKITGMFVDNFPQYHRDLQQTFTAILSENAPFSNQTERSEHYARLRSAAHKIKGTAGNLSATQVYEICGFIEEAAIQEVKASELQGLYEAYNEAVLSLMPVLFNYLEITAEQHS